MQLKETVRSGIIQNFEVAYELSWKMMKHSLETNISAESVDGVTRRELFKKAAKNRLIAPPGPARLPVVRLATRREAFA